MNKFEILAEKLGDLNLIRTSRKPIYSCYRQGITYYLRYKGYSVKEIALWQRKNLNVIYSQISTFERLLSVKDKLAVEVLSKIREVDG